MSLGAFMTDESRDNLTNIALARDVLIVIELGSWADEMEDMPVCKLFRPVSCFTFTNMLCSWYVVHYATPPSQANLCKKFF